MHSWITWAPMWRTWRRNIWSCLCPQVCQSIRPDLVTHPYMHHITGDRLYTESIVDHSRTFLYMYHSCCLSIACCGSELTSSPKMITWWCHGDDMMMTWWCHNVPLHILGTIELTNLKLKSTTLDSLNLPIKVVRGLVQKLHLKIPWTNLGAVSAMPCN